MKNNFTSLLLAILTFGSSLLQLQAQEYHEFAPIGAKWRYESLSVDTYVESIRDTILEEQHGKVLKIERQTKEGESIDIWEVIVYQEENTVYYYAHDQFQVLFDFEITEYKSCHSEFSPTISVWQEEPIVVNGVELRKFKAIYNTIFFSVNFTLVEKIGGNLFLACIAPELEDIGDLKCYEDNEIGYFCDEDLWTDIEEVGSFSSIDIYPNPSKDFIHISFPQNSLLENTSLTIYDGLGRVVKNDSPSILSDIYIGYLPSGLYFLELKDCEYFVRKLFYKE